jgi:hypothetical protein
MRHCDVTYSLHKFADNTFEYWYLNFRYVIQLRKPSSTHDDTGELNSYINIYVLFLYERLIMYKCSFFHNLVHGASRVVLSSSRSKGKYLEICLVKWLY